MNTWEESLFDWEVTGFSDKKVIPADILALIKCEDEAKSLDLYRNIDSVITRNGDVYEVAVPVIKMLLSMMPDWTAQSKIYCLDLLAEVALGDPVDIPPEYLDECMFELKLATWYFLSGLQFDSIEFIRRYIDILYALAEHYSEIRPKVTMYFTMSIKRDELSEEDIVYIQRNIEQLRALA